MPNWLVCWVLYTELIWLWIVELDIDGLKTSTLDPKFGVFGGGVTVPDGSVHCWLLLPAQVQIWTWVPEPPKPVSSRHLPEFGLISPPLVWAVQTCAAVPLQS